MKRLFRKLSLSVNLFVQRQGAVTAMEYALIGSLIAVAIITAIKLVGTRLVAVFNSIAAAL
jgi:pilus assembly protein Flp/PilA